MQFNTFYVEIRCLWKHILAKLNHDDVLYLSIFIGLYLLYFVIFLGKAHRQQEKAESDKGGNQNERNT